jgi:hypothetical protein
MKCLPSSEKEDMTLFLLELGRGIGADLNRQEEKKQCNFGHC